MIGVIRSFVFLTLAIFVAGTLALSAAPFKTEASVAMTAMPMAASALDCKTCDPHMNMAASCTLSCALAAAGGLVVPIHYVAAPTDCSLDFADVIASGLTPPPAFTPPRTIILI